MAIDLDGLAVFGAMARNPEAFGPLAEEAAKLAKGLLVKALRDRTVTVSMARAMAASLPEDAFQHATDSMKDQEVAAVAARLDPNDGGLRSEGRSVQALRIEELLKGSREPVPKVQKTTRVKVPAAPRKKAGVRKALKILSSKSMTAAPEDA